MVETPRQFKPWWISRAFLKVLARFRWWFTAPRRAFLKFRLKRRMFLVREVAQMARTLQMEEDGKLARLQIMLAPQTWQGDTRRCDTSDGGCGLRVKFGPLKMQRHGDRESWILICPSCRKQRVMLQTLPRIRILQRRALEEYRTRGDLGAAYERFEKAVIDHNRKLLSVRMEVAKTGPGKPPEMDHIPVEPEVDEGPENEPTI